MAIFRRRVNQLKKRLCANRAIQRKFVTDYTHTKPLSGRPDLMVANFRKIQEAKAPIQQALNKAKTRRQSGLLKKIRQAVLAPRLLRRQRNQLIQQNPKAVSVRLLPLPAAPSRTARRPDYSRKLKAA